MLTLRQQVEELYADKALLLDLQPAIGMDAATRKAAYLDGVHPKSATYTAMGQYAAPILQKWVEGR